jgi:hypothetical protein
MKSLNFPNFATKDLSKNTAGDFESTNFSVSGFPSICPILIESSFLQQLDVRSPKIISSDIDGITGHFILRMLGTILCEYLQTSQQSHGGFCRSLPLAQNRNNCTRTAIYKDKKYSP